MVRGLMVRTPPIRITYVMDLVSTRRGGQANGPRADCLGADDPCACCRYNSDVCVVATSPRACAVAEIQ
jgi:hypothetical protein